MAGNRTPVTRLGSEYSTTEIPMLAFNNENEKMIRNTQKWTSPWCICNTQKWFISYLLAVNFLDVMLPYGSLSIVI